MASPEPKIRISELEPGNYEDDKANAWLPASVGTRETLKYPFDAPEKAAARYTDGEVAKEKARATEAEKDLQGQLGDRDAILFNTNVSAWLQKEETARAKADAKHDKQFAATEPSELLTKINTLENVKLDKFRGDQLKFVKGNDTLSTGLGDFVDGSAIGASTGIYRYLPKIAWNSGYLIMMNADKKSVMVATCTNCPTEAVWFAYGTRENTSQPFDFGGTAPGYYDAWKTLATARDLTSLENYLEGKIRRLEQRVSELESGGDGADDWVDLQVDINNEFLPLLFGEITARKSESMDRLVITANFVPYWTPASLGQKNISTICTIRDAVALGGYSGYPIIEDSNDSYNYVVTIAGNAALNHSVLAFSPPEQVRRGVLVKFTASVPLSSP